MTLEHAVEDLAKLADALAMIEVGWVDDTTREEYEAAVAFVQDRVKRRSLLKALRELPCPTCGAHR